MRNGAAESRGNGRPAALPRYVLITPARNEVAFLEHTIRSVIAQTVLPERWVIVSDGSTDGTDTLVSAYLDAHPWMELLRLPERSDRNFAGKATAVAAGYARVAHLDFEIVGNLDADVSFEADYLEFLLTRFAAHPRLGVAGTPYREDRPGYDERFKSPAHVSGACQLFRRTCFDEIGGYRPSPAGGVDLIALLAAQALGWETRRFDERQSFHHRSVGSGLHARRARRLFHRGRMDYLLGSHPLFEIFRIGLQMKQPPYVFGGTLMLAGYGWAAVRGLERPMPPDLVAVRRRDQLARLGAVLRRPWRGRVALAPPLSSSEPGR